MGSAQAINDSGLIVGTSNTSEGEVRPFLWDEISGIRFLGTLGGLKSYGAAVNSQGYVVGHSNTDDNGAYGGVDRAFLWDELNGMRDLGTLPGGTTSEACAVNDVGGRGGFDVAGTSDTLIPDSGDFIGATRAFLLNSSSGIRDLGTLGGTNSYAHGMSNGPVVVGSAETADGEIHAFLWSEASGMRDLGTFSGGDYSQANSVNQDGQVVGYSLTPSGPPYYITESDGPSSGTQQGRWTSTN